MRVKIIGIGDPVRSLKSTLAHTDIVVSDFGHDLQIELLPTDEVHPTIDGVDCSLERNILNGISKLCHCQIILKRPGGVQSDQAISIGIPKHWDDERISLLERGIVRGLTSRTDPIIVTPLVNKVKEVAKVKWWKFWEKELH